MALVPSVTIQILYDGVDITADCVIAECSFTGRANGFPGEARVVIRDDLQTKRFVPGSTLELFINGRREWDGFAVQRKHNYWFDGHTANCYPCPHITPRKHILMGADRNILFTRRVLYNKAAPATWVANTWPAGTNDSTVITTSIANFLDDVDGIDYVTKVETVAVTDPWRITDQPGPSNMFGMLMREIAKETGAVFYIDPDRYLVYTDVNEPNAPFGLSDAPSSGEVGYREVTIFSDASEMVNDALIWGAGQGSSLMVFSRVTDAASVAAHGRWQNAGGFRPQVWTQGSVDRIADSIVYGSPANRRGHKDDAVTVSCVVWQPGLRVAQKVAVESTVHGYSDVVPIRNITMTFPAPDKVKYDVRLSHELDEPWTIIEPWDPPTRRRDPPGGDPPTVCEVRAPYLPNSPTLATTSANTPTDLIYDHYAIAGTQDWRVYIDAVPPAPNKWQWYGDNHYRAQGPLFESRSVMAEYSAIWADLYWYTLGNAGLVTPGERLWYWRNNYKATVASTNSVDPSAGVYYRADVELTMSGNEAERGMVGGGIFGPTMQNAQTSTMPHQVIFGLLSRTTQFHEPHTIPRALIQATMVAGQTITVPITVYFPSGKPFCWGVDFEEPEIGALPWVTNIKVTAILKNEGWYDAMTHTVAVGPDEDGMPCVPVPTVGKVCEEPGRLIGLRYRLRNPYLRGTTRVMVDGLTLSGGGIQYTESDPERGEIELVEEPASSPYVCYDAAGFRPAMPSAEALFMLPVTGPITGRFGAQSSLWPPAYWHDTYYEHFHNGVDFGVPTGTPVFAAAAGEVKYETQAAGGMMIHVYHPFHGFRTTYAHLSERVVANGANVQQGQLIAYSGASGNVTGAHLHWGLVFFGSPEDPIAYTDYSPQVTF